MPIETNLTLIFWNTIGGLIVNLPTYILVIWGVKTVAKQTPRWIQQVFDEQNKSKVIDRAIHIMELER